ncbi:MAG: hypothetical protein WDZ41_05820 [Candidatus Babeliales bacterium]
MKKIIFFILSVFCISMSGAFNAMECQPEQDIIEEGNETELVYNYLFQKNDEDKKAIVLKNNDFRDILPQIGGFVLARPEYKCSLNEEMKTWLLKQLIFVNNYHRTMDDQLKYPEQIKTFNLKVDLKENHIQGDYSIEIICWVGIYTKFKNLNQTYASSFDITNFHSSEFPKPIIRAAIYLDEKISKLHKKLLNNIYAKGIMQNKKYNLSESEEKHFKLLPVSFQKALKPHVSGQIIDSDSSSNYVMFGQIKKFLGW